MTLVRFNKPTFNTMLDRFFNDDFGPFFGRDNINNVPSVNIKEDENGFHLELAAPGLNKEDFKVNVDNDVLTISAENKVENEDKKDNYTRREFSYTSFKRSFTLPATAEGEKIEANYKDGVLNITVPKKEDAKPKRREIAIS